MRSLCLVQTTLAANEQTTRDLVTQAKVLRCRHCALRVRGVTSQRGRGHLDLLLDQWWGRGGGKPKVSSLLNHGLLQHDFALFERLRSNNRLTCLSADWPGRVWGVLRLESEENAGPGVPVPVARHQRGHLPLPVLHQQNGTSTWIATHNAMLNVSSYGQWMQETLVWNSLHPLGVLLSWTWQDI